jgi:hypothetical protein
LAAALALLGHWYGPSLAALLLQLVAAAIFAVGTVRPSALRPLYNAVMVVPRFLGRTACWFVRASQERRPARPSRRGQMANT